jgi:large subunit ribosomal protein L25
MQEITINANKRETAGKGVARKLRASGRIPGVYYGKGKETIPIDIESKSFEYLMHKTRSSNLIVNLNVDGNSTKALVRDIQHDPIGNSILHVDFYSIALDQEIQLMVPINFIGVSNGVRNEGGIQQSIMRELEISCLPDKIPASVDVDVSEMSIGDSIHVRDIVLEGVEIVSDLKRTVVTIIPPTVSKAAVEEVEGEEAAEEEGEGAEPEVITEKKEEEEEKE